MTPADSQAYDRLMRTATTERVAVDASVAAAKLGVSLSMIYKLARQGRLQGYAIGRRRLFYLDSIDALRQGNAFGSIPTPSPTAAQEPKLRPPRRKKTVKPLTLPTLRHLR
jgi:excisionase family DNA binding protein